MTFPEKNAGHHHWQGREIRGWWNKKARRI